MNLIEWIDLPNLGDERGGLVVAEANKTIPFNINRIYYIFDAKFRRIENLKKDQVLKEIKYKYFDNIRYLDCDKKTLSKLTGLSERTIDERRRAGNIPYIQLSGTNDEKGGRIILENGYEHMIQAKAYLKNVFDIENITVKTFNSIPLKIKDIANVNITSSNRRGMVDLNGQGETVGGIVVVRFGENPYAVIKAVKAKLETLKVDDVEVVETYDRTSLIDKAIDTLKNTLIEESIIVIIISGLFLFHFRSALIIIITLPITVLITFLMMKAFGMGSNIMSLGGIAIAIGAMVDATIVMVENAHKYLQGKENISNEERVEIIIKSAKQVGRPIFFALVLVVVSFSPIFALTGQEGRLFTPLAFTKSFAMMTGAILSITLVPILMIFLILLLFDLSM